MSLTFLNELGLSSTESQIYQLLLRLGETPVATITREARLKRPTVYKALSSLENKELITSRDLRKIKHFKPEPPTKLVEIADKESARIKQARTALNAILPGLSISYTNSTERPSVRVYEGVEGIKEIYNDMIVEKKPIYALLQTSVVEPDLYNWLTTKFVRKRVRERIHVKAIVASSKKSREYESRNKEEFRLSRMVDSKLFPFQHEIDIYGNKIAIIHYKEGGSLLGIVIDHPEISTSMKAWFDLAWNGAR